MTRQPRPAPLLSRPAGPCARGRQRRRRRGPRHRLLRRLLVRADRRTPTATAPTWPLGFDLVGPLSGFVDTSVHWGSQEGVSLSDLTLMAGPGLRFGKRGGTVFFVRALAGLVQDKASIDVLDVDISETSSSFGVLAGGGVDFRALGAGDYLGAIRRAGRLPVERLRRRASRADTASRPASSTVSGARDEGHPPRVRRDDRGHRRGHLRGLWRWRLFAERALDASDSPSDHRRDPDPADGRGRDGDRLREPRRRAADAARRHPRVADRGGGRLAHLHPRVVHRRPADVFRARRSTARATARASGRPVRW